MRFENGYKTRELPQSSESMPITCGSFNWMSPAVPAGGYRQPMPTGFPTGGTATPLLPSQSGTPAAPLSEQTPATVQSTMFTPGFLRTQIGRRMRIEFLLGTGPLVDRTGTLINVGASYILLKMIDSDDVMMCDIYSIKFVTIFY